MGEAVRRTFAVSLLLLAVAAASAIGGPAAPSPPKPAIATVADLDREVAKAEDAIARLLQKAQDTIEHERVVRYRAYTATQLGDASLERVRVGGDDGLLSIVADDQVPPEVRTEAVIAITSETAQRNDTDLSIEGKGLKRPRAAFSVKIVTMLGEKDNLLTRSLAQRLLDALWPGAGAREADITKYNPRESGTWADARAAWMKWLRKT